MPDLLQLKTLPYLTRRNYYYEFKHIVPWSVLAGLVEGQFASIVVARTFHGSARLIAVASATPAASYLFSLFWGMLCVGRPKIRLLSLLSAGVVLLAGAIGAIPATASGGLWFIAQMALAQVLLAGVVTVRSAVWRANYPRLVRGRITARLQTVRFIVSISTVLTAAWVCDHDPASYRYIFPIAALLGMVGVLFLSSIRIRGERGELRRINGETGEVASDMPVCVRRTGRLLTSEVHRGQRVQRQPPISEAESRVGMAEPFSLTALLSPQHVLGRMVRVFRNDRRFARYCLAQSFSGVANFMTIPVVVAVVTQGLDLASQWGFWISTGLIQAIPQLVRLGSIGRWARFFDRVGVVRFRVLNISFWSSSIAIGWLATAVALHADRIGPAYLPIAVALFALRGLGNGLGLGGGALAWNIGHLHFAKAHEAEVYMGIHVFLTGLRGLFAPFLGMWLFQTRGNLVWLIAFVFSLCSITLYAILARSECK